MEYTYSLTQLLADTSVGKSHVVLLGAGASLAAFSQGDASNKKLPNV